MPTAAVTYAWDFGDGQTATTSTSVVSHTYQMDGPKHVTATVQAPNCTDGLARTST